jgi:hypothetical protein
MDLEDGRYMIPHTTLVVILSAGLVLGLGIFQALAGKASLFSSVLLHACCVGEEKSPFLQYSSHRIYIMGKSRLLLDQWLLYIFCGEKQGNANFDTKAATRLMNYSY